MSCRIGGPSATDASGLLAGMDLEMPGYDGDGEKAIIAAVLDGTIPVETLDLSVRRILTLISKSAGLPKLPADFSYIDMHHELAAKAACEGAVLLKNDKGCLPLSRNIPDSLNRIFRKTAPLPGSRQLHGDSDTHEQRIR